MREKFFGKIKTRINNKSMFYKQWFEKRIIFIQNLCNENEEWLNYSQFVIKYDLKNCQINFMGLMNFLKQLIRKSESYQNINLKYITQINFKNSVFDTTDGKN